MLGETFVVGALRFDIIIFYCILYNNQLAAFPNSRLVIWHQNSFRLTDNMFSTVLSQRGLNCIILHSTLFWKRLQYCEYQLCEKCQFSARLFHVVSRRGSVPYKPCLQQHKHKQSLQLPLLLLS